LDHEVERRLGPTKRFEDRPGLLENHASPVRCVAEDLLGSLIRAHQPACGGVRRCDSSRESGMADLDRVRMIFEKAVSAPPADRDGVVSAACAGDAELLALVRGMLSEHEGMGSIVAHAAHPSPPGVLQEGHTVGPYRLVSVIGEGAFGTVWLAEQREPIRRRVALKVLKLGMDSKEVLARFEAERQALALMNHPNVAKVLDAGITERGQSYFAMEYVAGNAITRFCDDQKLSVPGRITLFIQVCQAVQHAHTKGIIHRDIKPSNVLVELLDGVAAVKVIDFGIAKAISHIHEDATAFTQTGTIIGTPEYMSPEQAGGEPDVDTRTDIYSLGVLLYELLTGLLPFDATQLRRAGYAEIQRIIREVDPPKPSTRLSSALSGAGAAFDKDMKGPTPPTTIAENRRTRATDLMSLLRRELEWIPLKAMRKARSERYRSPAELADDLQRYLAGQALLAGPESRAYRARKFVRRNKGAVAAGLAVTAALLIGLATTLWQAREASIQRDQANAARDAERARADQLKKVSDFQSQMLAQIDTTQAGVDLMADIRARYTAALENAGVPEAERTARLDALQQELVRVNATDAAAAMIDRTILKPAVAAIGEQFKDQAVVDAQLRQTLADLYLTIGLYNASYPLQEASLATRRRLLGEEHPDTLTSINNMGGLLLAQGKLAEAEPYHREAMEKRRRVLGDDHPDTLTSINNMGSLLREQAKLAEVEPYWREAMEKRRRVLGEEHPDTLTSINNMGVLLLDQGRLAEAEPLYREAMEKSRRVLGDEHPDTLIRFNNMGYLLYAQGKLDEAEVHWREALGGFRRVLGEEHPNTLVSIATMGFLLQSQGKLAEAEPYLREALAKSRRVLGDEHPSTLSSINNLGLLLQSQGKLVEVEPYWREVLEKSRRVLGEEHPDTLVNIHNMGGVLRAQGKLAEAEPFYREALEKFRRVLGDEHPNTLFSITNMSALLREQGEHQEAIDLLTPAEHAAREVFTGGYAGRLAGFLTTLGRARVGLGYDPDRFALAETNLLEAYPIFVQALGEAHKDTTVCVQGLVDLYTAWHAAEPGKGYDAKAAEWQAKLDQAVAAEERAAAPK